MELETKAGNLLNLQTVELVSGEHAYRLRGAKTGDRIRLHAQVGASSNGQSPILRAVSLSGVNGAERWSTPREWRTGAAEKSIAVNYSYSTSAGMD